MATYPVIVYGVAPPPPPVIVKPFRPGQNRWFGWDGSTWDLGDWRGGVIFADGGVSGLSLPPFEHYRSTSPAASGSKWRGVRTQERPVDWNLLVFSKRDADEWREREAAFMKTLRPDKTGVWEHTTPSGERRYLTMRCEGGEMTSLERKDPHALGWSLHQLQFVAEDPYWYGAEILRSWAPPTGAEGASFFDPAGSPPFHITPSSNIDGASVPNPGDVAAWPIWTFIGPLTDITVTFNGGTLELPDVADGQALVVNTDPRVATATRNGADVMALVDTWDPRPLPPGEETGVTVSVSGTGTVRLSLAPRYYRAW